MDAELERLRRKRLEKLLRRNKPKVIVYSTPACPYCRMAKEFLRSQNIEFEDVDVSKDRQRAIEMVRKSGQTGVPVLDINGTIIIGFNLPAIKQALHL